jgi:hypothetical protein
VLGPRAHARRIAQTPFEELPFHLTMKCDGCLFNEFCMKHAAERDDLSLLPHLTEGDKSALHRCGVTTTSQLANLKEIRRRGVVYVDGEPEEDTRLIPADGQETLARELATTWPVGPRLDELVHRAKRYRKWKKDPVDAIGWIPGKGYGSLPWVDAGHNPNLLMVYLDAQHDYLHDRVYLLGALVVGHEHGTARPARRRSVVRVAAAPPATHEIEEALVREWVEATIQAVLDAAAPDTEGDRKAPIHLVFNDSFAQKALLDALARHTSSVLGTTALYDFVTQIAAFDSALVTFLDSQIREKKNYPMVCQSLQSVAAYLGFDWNAGRPYRRLFHEQHFDYAGWLGTPARPIDPDAVDWITRRARFNSQIPLEYAYNAWDELPLPADGQRDVVAGYRNIDRETLLAFHARRLEAMEHIARDFRGNKQTSLTPFNLPDLDAFTQKATTLAQALEEFVFIERHVELAAWKNARHPAPEQRVLAGNTLLVRYVEEDQDPGMAAQNRDFRERHAKDAAFLATHKAQNPDATRRYFTAEEKAESKWTHGDTVYRLRIDIDGVACDLNEALALTTTKEGDGLVFAPRLTVDSRLPVDEQREFAPTPKQLPYGMRADLVRLEVERRDGRAVMAWAHVTFRTSSSSNPPGFAFRTGEMLPLEANRLYTLDPDPNSWTGAWAAAIARDLIAGGQNTLYAILAGSGRPAPNWPPAFHEAQRRFRDGLDALHAAGVKELGFEEGKRSYIGEHGGDGLLLVQGPPGTGKSYSTAFALLARFQGALACNRPLRIILSCKTHAATDVLIHNLADVQAQLRRLSRSHPDIFTRYFDARVLDIPLFRFREGGSHPGITLVPQDKEREKGAPKAWKRFNAEPWCAIAATPGGVYRFVKDQHGKEILGHSLAQCLVLDEASQMSLPEAIMAALPLAPDGNAIVVGDHRQMPPIVKNDWAAERRRTFAEFRSYESLFLTLLGLQPPIIRFAESFRLHADMAEFLRREIYVHDGIPYHSRRHGLIPEKSIGDSFLASVLAPNHPLTVVVHDEATSQVRNGFEQQLLTPVLALLADPAVYNLSPDEGFGVVVTHRAQRAAMQEAIADLRMVDPGTGELLVTGVDTVERYQGGERTVIVIATTESDRDYLLANGSFLLDPRRLTVALSRAKRKLVLVAARSVFELFSADEETFANAQLWKNLLRHTCTVPLWEGDRHGVHVEVWGNRSISAEDPVGR